MSPFQYSAPSHPPTHPTTPPPPHIWTHTLKSLSLFLSLSLSLYLYLSISVWGNVPLTRSLSLSLSLSPFYPELKSVGHPLSVLWREREKEYFLTLEGRH